MKRLRFSYLALEISRSESYGIKEVCHPSAARDLLCHANLNTLVTPSLPLAKLSLFLVKMLRDHPLRMLRLRSQRVNLNS
jgi:hypothetical protein